MHILNGIEKAYWNIFNPVLELENWNPEEYAIQERMIKIYSRDSAYALLKVAYEDLYMEKLLIPLDIKGRKLRRAENNQKQERLG